MGFYIGGGLSLLIAVIGFFVLGSAKRKREKIIGTETYSAKEIREVYQTTKDEMLEGEFSFPCELKGVIAADDPVTAPMSGKRGVWYRSVVERQRQETRWTTDNKGRRRKQVQQIWETVSDETDRSDFYVTDESGRIPVRSEGAEIIGAHVVYDRFEKEPGYGENRVLGYRKQEWLVPLDVPVYALGHVTDRGGSLAMQATGGDDDRYIISLKSERELVEGLEGRVKLWRVLVPVLGVIGAALILLGVFDPWA